MKETRMIRVIGVQKNEDGEESTIELATEGTFYNKDGSYYIVYDESEISGLEGATTTVKIEVDRKVTMKRFGTSSANLTFEEGKSFETNYMTAFGDFKMEVKTNTLDIEIAGETGKGKIEIDYDLKISGALTTSNKLKIQLI